MKKLLAAVTVLAVSTAQAGVVIHVDAGNCPGPGSGSVRDPYCSIQTAIDNAVDTDEVVVAPGTYFESINFLGKAIWLHSSDGAEVTIIDGTGFFHVVQCVTFEGLDTVLDGFTITGGSADGDSFPDDRGGGMSNFDSSPTVTNCTFSGNSAIVDGGGMYNFLSSPTVTNCTFSGNMATEGGGMANFLSSPTVTNCTFTANSANGFGGGMSNGAISNPTVANCTFSGNTTGSHGGGMFNNFSSSPTVTNCTFEGNAAEFGGGMYNRQESSPTVSDCTFIGNTASEDGGGMRNFDNSGPTVTNCTFSGNFATLGGGMANFTGSPTVTNCTFTGNSALVGGGMYNGVSSPTVTNCSFSGNSATNGQALAFDSFMQQFPSNLIMTNSILWDGGNEIWNNDESTITISYTDVQGGWSGTGNIDTDPLFVDPDNGNYRLSAGSRCIDAGDNTAVPEGVLRDLDGNPRFVDSTFVGTMATVDMGAYEFQRSVGRGPGMRDVLTLLGWNALPELD